ncbi:MAG: SDR family NAD(P)-dependent oxidoreductase [Spirochaetaceae bacterium]|nr:MAG: SDR family NAD(P)-dependent oxidoreductase [Spirochaetaceae bacterium]
MGRIELKNRTILITGASRGLGKHLALYLARIEGASLVLVGRSRESLQNVADEIGATCSVDVKIIAQDLLADNGAQILFDKLRHDRIFGLINNAGMTYYGDTEASQIDRFRSIIALDFKVVVELCLLFLSRFKANGEGFILNITSLASFVPIPYQSIYAAAKCATQSLSESLAEENKGSSIVISTFAPAGIVTDLIAESGLTLHMQKHLKFYITPEHAAELAIKALKRGRRLILPGYLTKIMYFFINVLPRATLLGLCTRIYRYDKYRMDACAKI